MIDEPTDTHHSSRMLIDGAGFALDIPDHVAPLWGEGANVIWSQGEALMICGPQGIGKTTLAQALALAAIGIGDPDLLGLPVQPLTDGKRVLYMAMDRPAQAARSFRRMVTEQHRSTLAERLLVHRGPLEHSLIGRTEHVIGMALAHDVGVIVVDSLKDIAPGFARDEIGAGYNIARQRIIAAGIEMVELHHQRKATADNRKPRSLDDVYGSVWLTSGAGSVVVLWGEAGDPVLELRHLKTVRDEVGPFEVYVDHDRGAFTIERRTTIRGLLEAASHDGITALDVATELYGASPSAAKREKARRALEKLNTQGLAVKVAGSGPNDPAVYRPVARRNDSVRVREASREALTHPHGTPQNPLTQTLTHHHGATTDPPPYKEGADREGQRDADAELGRIAGKFPDLEGATA